MRSSVTLSCFLSLIVSFLSILDHANCYAQSSDWERLFLFDGPTFYYGSSQLEDPEAEYGDIEKYSGYNLFDDDSITAWVEGVNSNGIGEYLLIGNENELPAKIQIRNGYQKSNSLYQKNSRPKALKINLYVAYHIPADVTELGGNFYCLPFRDSILIDDKLILKKNILKLRDKMGTQEFAIPFDKEKVLALKNEGDPKFEDEFAERIAEVVKYGNGFGHHVSFYGYIIKLEIIEVYKGTHWDDTCISGIKLSL